MGLRSILVGCRRDRLGSQQHHRTPREQEPIRWGRGSECRTSRVRILDRRSRRSLSDSRRGWALERRHSLQHPGGRHRDHRPRIHAIRNHAPPRACSCRYRNRSRVLHSRLPFRRYRGSSDCAINVGGGFRRCVLASEERRRMTQEPLVLDEIIHQPVRLRIMTMLVSIPESDRVSYGFVQKSLDLTGGNLTTHLRKLENADYLNVTKEFHNQKPRTWIQATVAGRQAFAEYFTNLQKVLSWRPES
ncbi:MAG: helix-turn-helix domain-containing protein [Chloroflexi bacterium]|nr:helix-turn-helix domain-containing protein [Chloroflexota bacterium]